MYQIPYKYGVLHNAKHFAYGTKVLVEDLGKFVARDQATLLR